MKRTYSISSIIAATALLLAACGAATATPAAAQITAPAQQAQFTAGESITIEGSVTGTDVKKVQVLLNNQAIAVIDQASEPGKFLVAFDFPLSPETLAGSNVIQLKGLNDTDAAVVTSDLVFVNVRGQPTATAPPPPTPTSIPTAAAPAAPAATTAPAAVEPAKASNQITNKDNEFINVRKGPALVFDPPIGQLKQTQSASVKAKSEDGKWWQIEFTGGEGGLGWVFAELVQFAGDANAVPVVKVALPTAVPVAAAPAAPVATAAVVPLAPAAPAAPTAPPAAVLPYSQSDSFAPRNDIGDVPLGHNGEPNTSKWVWNITGAQRAEVEISIPGSAPDIFDCPLGNLSGIAPNSASGKRLPMALPQGEFPFTITEKGVYLFKIWITKADGSQTSIERWVIFGCYKKPGR